MKMYKNNHNESFEFEALCHKLGTYIFIIHTLLYEQTFMQFTLFFPFLRISIFKMETYRVNKIF